MTGRFSKGVFMNDQMVAPLALSFNPLEKLRTHILENGKPRLNNSDKPSVNSEIMYLEVGRYCRAFLEVDGLEVSLMVELESMTHAATVNELGAMYWLENLTTGVKA